jgi:light-regulated signal transduction histidine kinase (bacteriophytochrome)
VDKVPAFGQADLTNCEREPIHLAGSVQPHGALLVLRERDLAVIQASANAAALLGVEGVLGRTAAEFGRGFAEPIAHLQRHAALDEPVAVRLLDGAGRRFDAAVHRIELGTLVVELESADVPPPGTPAPPELAAETLGTRLAAAVQRLSATASVGTLADAVVQEFRELTGYDRVMVYKFDPDGHGKVIAEARHPRLDSLLGHHYPATDIPQRARELYLRNRVRMLVDVDYVPQRLEPERLPTTGAALDMSHCALRSMSPLHLQYLRNMGVTATLTASLVREGQLWGLIAAHHYAPRYLRKPLRAAADLIAEVASTRISAIENYSHAQVALMVRRLEQRLVEATSAEGDWRYALFRTPRTLLQPLDATGAVLMHDGELIVTGEVPSTHELRSLIDWVHTQCGAEPFACSALARANPKLAALAPTASGVLAVRLSTARPDYMIWLRKEQLQSITWAGDPTKPMVDDNPLELSPRRSFAAWSEIVRGTAVPWSTAELALGRAIGSSLVDMIVQVNAVRLLIAEHQLARIRAAVAVARQPVLVVDSHGAVLFANEAFAALRGAPLPAGGPAAHVFGNVPAMRAALDRLRGGTQRWQQEAELLGMDGRTLPVSVRAESVTAGDATPLGFILTVADLRESHRAQTARQHLEASLHRAASGNLREADEVVSAILTNASLAAMDIAEARSGPPIAPLIEELEASTQRAAALYAQIRTFLA